MTHVKMYIGWESMKKTVFQYLVLFFIFFEFAIFLYIIFLK